MVKEGYIPIRLVALFIPGDLILVWSTLKIWIYGARERMDWPTFGNQVEYLFDTLIEYAEQHPELQIKIPKHTPLKAT